MTPRNPPGYHRDEAALSLNAYTIDTSGRDQDGAVMPLGTPGGDVQAQALLQVLLNLVVFGLRPQAAVEAPRFATQSFQSSPHLGIELIKCRCRSGRQHAGS